MDKIRVDEATSQPDFRAVRAEVAQLLRDNSIIDPPIDPARIAGSYGYRIISATFPDHRRMIMGFIDFKNDSIYVNAADPPNRRRFTIAHELGHARLHRAYFENFPDAYRVLLRQPMGAARDKFEIEANAFAADLLVPLSFLKKYMDFATLEELARLFFVSEEVIGYRLKNLGKQ